MRQQTSVVAADFNEAVSGANMHTEIFSGGNAAVARLTVARSSLHTPNRLPISWCRSMQMTLSCATGGHKPSQHRMSSPHSKCRASSRWLHVELAVFDARARGAWQ